MSLWRRFREQGRARRTGISLLLALPILWLLTGEGEIVLVAWSAMVVIASAQLTIVPRFFPDVDGVDAFDRRHPRYGNAWWLDLAIVLIVAVLFVTIYNALRP